MEPWFRAKWRALSVWASRWSTASGSNTAGSKLALPKTSTKDIQTMSNVIHLYPEQSTPLQMIDFAGERADDFRSILIIGITKDGKQIAFLSNASPLVDKYAMAGAVQSWVAEISANLPYVNEDGDE